MKLQMSCLLPASRPGRWLPALALAFAACASAQGTAGAAGPAASLVAGAQAWLSGRHQVPSASVGVQPLDARVQVRPCNSGWQFDQPFSDLSSLRARCADPVWQVYLKVVLPAQVMAPPAGTAPPSPAPAGPAAQSAPPASPVAAAGPHLVRRGQTVVVTMTPAPGLSITARLEALDDGRMGDTIRLKNRDSGRLMTAVVNGQNTAQGL